MTARPNSESTAQAKPVALVVGAGSAIAQALIKQTLEQGARRVIAVSRGDNPQLTEAEATAETEMEQLDWLQCDYSEAAIASVCDHLKALPEQGAEIDRVYILNGILHSPDITPEKRLEDISAQSLQQVFQINAVNAILWLQALKPLLRGKRERVITVLSARVGSIDDNQRGGWYAYRASKAALNMLFKTAAIEYGRTAKQTRFLAFHPGTTDTPLSQPFQKSVPAGKLFSPAFVAERLLALTDRLPGDDLVQFLDWDGESVAW